MPVSDDLSSGRVEAGWRGRDTAGRYETWQHALFSLLRLSRVGTPRAAGAISRAVPLLLVPCTREISIHHSQSSQSIFIYDREIGAKISVSVSISRFLRHENLLYTVPLCWFWGPGIAVLWSCQRIDVCDSVRLLYLLTYLDFDTSGAAIQLPSIRATGTPH